jgi:hypothetical protein
MHPPNGDGDGILLQNCVRTHERTRGGQKPQRQISPLIGRPNDAAPCARQILQTLSVRKSLPGPIPQDSSHFPCLPDNVCQGYGHSRQDGRACGKSGKDTIFPCPTSHPPHRLTVDLVNDPPASIAVPSCQCPHRTRRPTRRRHWERLHTHARIHAQTHRERLSRAAWAAPVWTPADSRRLPPV